MAASSFKITLEQKIKSLTEKLIVAETGLEPQSTNFNIAMEFILTNFSSHSFSSPNQHQIDRRVKRICEKFRINNNLSKSERLFELCEILKTRRLLSTHDDVHHSIIDLLLRLSDSPLQSHYSPRVHLLIHGSVPQSAQERNRMELEELYLRKRTIQEDEYQHFSSSSELSDWSEKKQNSREHSPSIRAESPQFHRREHPADEARSLNSSIGLDDLHVNFNKIVQNSRQNVCHEFEARCAEEARREELEFQADYRGLDPFERQLFHLPKPKDFILELTYNSTENQDTRDLYKPIYSENLEDPFLRPLLLRDNIHKEELRNAVKSTMELRQYVNTCQRQVVGDVLLMLQGVRNTETFYFDENKFKMRAPFSLSHLSQGALVNFVALFLYYASQFEIASQVNARIMKEQGEYFTTNIQDRSSVFEALAVQMNSEIHSIKREISYLHKLFCFQSGLDQEQNFVHNSELVDKFHSTDQVITLTSLYLELQDLLKQIDFIFKIVKITWELYQSKQIRTFLKVKFLLDQLFALLCTKSFINKEQGVFILRLFYAAVFPYISLLNKWAVCGNPDDEFDQFFIDMMNLDPQNWKAIHFLKRQEFRKNKILFGIPIFLQKIASKIIKVGRFALISRAIDMKLGVQGRASTHVSYFTDLNIFKETEEELKQKYFRNEVYHVQHFKSNFKNKEIKQILEVLEQDELRDEQADIDDADLFLRKRYEIEAQQLKYYKEQAPFYSLYEWEQPTTKGFKMPLVDTQVKPEVHYASRGSAETKAESEQKEDQRVAPHFTRSSKLDEMLHKLDVELTKQKAKVECSENENLEHEIRDLIYKPVLQIYGKNLGILEILNTKCNLGSQLKALKGIYLGEDGYLLSQFCQTVFEEIQNTGIVPRGFELNNLFHRLVKDCCVKKEDQYSLFKVVEKQALTSDQETKKPKDEAIHRSIACLDSIIIEYKVDWPLNIIFHRDAIRRYNKILSFLLKIERLRWSLNRCRQFWIKDAYPQDFESRLLHRFYLTQNLMLNYVKSFESYLKHYIIPKFSRAFQLEIQSGILDIDELVTRHDLFLQELSIHGLLTSKSKYLVNIIYAIFEQILVFRSLFVLFIQKQEMDYDDTELEEISQKLNQIRSEFKAGIKKVFTVLKKSHDIKGFHSQLKQSFDQFFASFLDEQI